MPDRSELPGAQFPILYRQFLVRIVDLEALSARADVIKLLGQFAAVLVLISIIMGLVALGIDLNTLPPQARMNVAWTAEHRLIAMSMLVVGIFAVLSWESIFPDRRDVMVLAPLPVPARTIFFAKVAASATALGLSILALNAISGIAWPLVLAHAGLFGTLRSLAAYWLTLLASGTFLYCSVLTVQGLTTLLLPRRYGLHLSSILQITAFCLFLAVYFLAPQLASEAALTNPENRQLLARLPSYWFLAAFNQLNGSMQPFFKMLALRAWIALALSVAGAISTLLFSYFHTMRKIVDEPDIVPRKNRAHWSPRLGSTLQTAMVLFSFRSLVRSRQHRVVMAFYLGVGFAIALSCLNIPAAQQDMANPLLHPASLRFLISTIVIMSFAVVGVRVSLSLPIALQSNWIFRVTQVRSSRAYIKTTRLSLLVLAVAPVLIGSAIFSLPFQPWQQAAGHLIVLGLLGLLFTELSLLNFDKIPFTCSFLPGKANVQFAFWAYILLLIPFIEKGALFEQRALERPLQYLLTVGVLSIFIIAIAIRNTFHAKSAVLHFEELPPDVIVGLELGAD